MISKSMQNLELINVKLSHSQSTVRNGSMVASTVIMEFTLQDKTPLYNVWQRQQCCTPNIQQAFVWQMTRYGFYGQDISRQIVFDDGVLADKMAATEIFRNMDRLFENFIIIEFKLWICWKYLYKYFPMCQNNRILNRYAPNLTLYNFLP